MEKHVYQIGPRGELVGVTVLDKSDLDPKEGKWLVPAGCIEAEPIIAKDGFIRFWDGSAWVYETIPEPEPEKQEAEHDRLARLDKEARARRNGLLRESDWTQLADVPKATRDKWKAYRQALRDLPDSIGWPTLIEWPEPPK